MKCIFFVLSIFCFFNIYGVLSDCIDNPCTLRTSNKAGVCKPLSNCPSAQEVLKKTGKFQNCCYANRQAIVCCEAGADSSTNQATTGDTNTQCGPIPTDAVKIQKTGQKAIDNCIDIIKQVYPCTLVPSMLPGRKEYTRKYTCGHVAIPLIVGGERAGKTEFPHMALLGFDSKSEGKPKWECGGSLISDRWVLTAAHCTINRENEEVKYVRLGSPNVEDSVEPGYSYTVVNITSHDNYSYKAGYNDIALLKLDRIVTFDERVRPACLHTGTPTEGDKYITAGWGSVSYGGPRSDELLKVTVEHFSHGDCNKTLIAAIKSGVQDQIQVCAGHRTKKSDSCQGDSGGPLMVYNPDVACTYLVVGITSKGTGCGTAGVPGIYTRVAAFIPWIESHVWPDNP